jgi:hypothetical protein
MFVGSRTDCLGPLNFMKKWDKKIIVEFFVII